MLTVIGEALIDVVNKPDQPAKAHPGGSPMNVAVGVSRLGHQVEFIGRFGNDDYGHMIAEHLTDSGVKIPFTADEKKTSVAQANIGESGSADYDFDIDWSLDSATEELAHAVHHSSAIHVGSIGSMLEPGAAQVLKTVCEAEKTALISYDPNCRPAIIPDIAQARSWAEAIVSHTDFVKASDEDLLWLYPEQTIEESAKAWLELGASLVAVTRGEQGVWAINKTTSPGGVEIPAHRVDVIDTVGAGDSLMAAFLAYLLDQRVEGEKAAEDLAEMPAQEITKMLTFAATAAGITVSRAGANPPTRDEFNEVLGSSSLR